MTAALIRGGSLRAALAGLLVLSVASGAGAATLGYQTLHPSNTPSDPNVTTGSGFVNVESVPGSDNFGDTFFVPDGVNLLNGAPLTGGGFGFYDDWIIQITSATVNSLTSTITLGASSGISNLQVRLFALPVGPYDPINPGTTIYDAWSTAVSSGSSTITYSVLNDTNLAAGTYVLQVRGRVTGTSNGSYSGVVNLAPIPVPAAAWLFGSALGLAPWLRRRASR